MFFKKKIKNKVNETGDEKEINRIFRLKSQVKKLEDLLKCQIKNHGTQPYGHKDYFIYIKYLDKNHVYLDIRGLMNCNISVDRCEYFDEIFINIFKFESMNEFIKEWIFSIKKDFNTSISL